LRRRSADLYVRRFSLPTPFSNDCGSAKRGGRAGKCQFKTVNASVYYIGVYGFTAFTNLKLKATYS
jgi:hypothetical protein